MKLSSTLAFCASFGAVGLPGIFAQGRLRIGAETPGSGVAISDANFDAPGSDMATSDAELNSCDCGAGHCDQRGCGPGATCGAGHCNQENLDSPTCGAGHCNQRNATNPTCGAGHCNQANATMPTCGAGHCCQDGATLPSCAAGHCNCALCIGGETLLYSCTAKKVVSARDVSIGDQIQAVNSETGESVCSDVYYVFPHKESSLAVQITTSDETNTNDSFTVSFDHILYVGESFEERRPVHSQDIEIGDKLVTSVSSTNGYAEVIKVDMVDMDLINVLTVDPHIEVQRTGSTESIIISAHSVDEAAYQTLFAPVRYIYLALGASAVQYMMPMFNAVDYLFAKQGLYVMKMMTKK